MTARFEELDWQQTPLGEISLRRRREPSLQVDVYEVRLGDEFLMSSLFTVAEVELARLPLAELPHADLDVVVGGLGLGYTAATALADARVRTMVVVEALGEVIGWHQRGLLPLSPALTSQKRCQLVQGDFFAMASEGFAPDLGGACQQWHAIVVDIDHSPRHVLHPDNARLYTPAGLRGLAAQLHAGGVFALWSDDGPDAEFLSSLRDVFAAATAHVVPFPNHYTGGTSANTVYVATLGER